jgi:hypothetical protein
MKYIECPQIYEPVQGEQSVFLAGGISNCADWQTTLVNLLQDTNLVLLNPRRKNFSLNNLEMERQQIQWEYEHLQKATATSFWFPKETLCPITLYELGKQSVGNKPLFIGVNPEYLRMRDVVIQTRLIRPEIVIAKSLDELAQQIKQWENKK